MLILQEPLCDIARELHLVSSHGIGLHMGVLAVGCADVPMQEGALTADGGAH